MEQGWFYSEGEQSVGPVSLAVLTGALRRMPQPGQVAVWRAGFKDWCPAEDVPELAALILKHAPVVVAPDPRLDRWTTSEPEPEAWVDDGLPEMAKPKRRWPFVAATTVVATIVVAGAVYAVRNLPASPGPESRVALPSVSPKSPQKEAAKPDPAVVLAQLTETATQAAAATDALAQKLWASIEPPTMRLPDYATASLAELESSVGDLRVAEANVVEVQTRYIALLKAERDLIAEAVQSSELGEDSRAELLAGVDERQTGALELANRMLLARADFYRAMQAMQAVAIDQFGKYKASPGGQIRFSSKAATDRFAAAAEELNAVNKRLELIEDRIFKARQPQPLQPSWKDMMIK